jgi:class 3 adenylate cyclase
MQCLHCQFDNPPTMHFCVECGASLQRRCPQCGAEAQPTFKFCGQCGAALEALEPESAQPPMAKAQVYQRQEAKIQSGTPRHLAEKILATRSALEGERRQVSVLFADVANFTTLAERLDPEVVHEIMDRCFERGEHGLAEEFFRRAWALLDEDLFMRWRWHIPLLRARGELALAEGRRDEAWSFAVQSLELATQTDSRKHVARAQRLQGKILAASGRLDDAAHALEASVRLAESLQTPREVWLGKGTLGKVLVRLGREKEWDERKKLSPTSSRQRRQSKRLPIN